jgi:hypothetical protein
LAKLRENLESDNLRADDFNSFYEVTVAHWAAVKTAMTRRHRARRCTQTTFLKPLAVSNRYPVLIGFCNCIELVVTFSFFFIFLSASVPAFAQTSGITGVVNDSSGAAVPNARVALTRNGVNAAQRTTTNGNGAYSFSSMEAGEYTLSVEANGFTPARQANIQVDARQALTINLKLEF